MNMKRERSIRFRLTAWYALVLAAGLAVFAGSVWFSMRETLLREIDESLRSRADSFEAFFTSELADEVKPNHVKQELREYCAALPASISLDLVRADGGFKFTYPAGGSHFADPKIVHRQITFQGDRYDLQIQASVENVRHTLNLLAVLLVALIPAVTGIACLGGMWLSRRALEPVSAMTGEAQSIEISNLSQRLPVPRTGDELQSLAEAWNKMLGRLEDAVGTLSQFTADASHELRTPLAVIRTSAELALRRDRTGAQYQESLREIMTEAERVTGLVESLLYLARNDSSSVEMPLEMLDLAAPLRVSLAEVRALAREKNVEFRESIPDAPVFVRGNQAALRRLFLALLDNALKYSGRGSEVLAALHGGEVVIADRGAGISAEDLPHIFQRFYRADKVRNPDEGGYGLGLSLADSIARRHGAEIHVRSEPGKGSEFRVVFPVGSGATPNATATYAPPAAGPRPPAHPSPQLR